MPHIKSNTQLWVNKGNFIYKVPEIKQLNNWWFHFICLQFRALTFALDLGRTTKIHADICMYVSHFIHVQFCTLTFCAWPWQDHQDSCWHPHVCIPLYLCTIPCSYFCAWPWHQDSCWHPHVHICIHVIELGMTCQSIFMDHCRKFA